MAENNTFTQEQVNSIVESRLAKEKEKYADYESLKQQVADFKSKDYDGQITKLTADLKAANDSLSEKSKNFDDADKRAKSAETKLSKIKVAAEYGIPPELADRISGETEEDMKKDAEMLSKFTSMRKVAPLAGNNGKNDVWSDFAAQLSKKIK